jgi:hypothetical protein
MGYVQNCDKQFLYKPCWEGKDKRTMGFLELGQTTGLNNEVNWERYEVHPACHQTVQQTSSCNS